MEQIRSETRVGWGENRPTQFGEKSASDFRKNLVKLPDP